MYYVDVLSDKKKSFTNTQQVVYGVYALSRSVLYHGNKRRIVVDAYADTTALPPTNVG